MPDRHINNPWLVAIASGLLVSIPIYFVYRSLDQLIEPEVVTRSANTEPTLIGQPSAPIVEPSKEENIDLAPLAKALGRAVARKQAERLAKDP